MTLLTVSNSFMFNRLVTHSCTEIRKLSLYFATCNCISIGEYNLQSVASIQPESMKQYSPSHSLISPHLPYPTSSSISSHCSASPTQGFSLPIPSSYSFYYLPSLTFKLRSAGTPGNVFRTVHVSCSQVSFLVGFLVGL